jgi:hypothetical protein
MITSLGEITELIKNFILRYYGQRENVDTIIDSTHPSPSNKEYTKLVVLSAVTGFECEDKSLISTSGTYPTSFAEGDVLYGIFKNIVITNGSIKAFSK